MIFGFRPLGIPVIVNDRVDVAVAADADGVHLGDDDLSVKVARKMLGPLRTLGVSAKTPEQALRAARDGADYVGAGASSPLSPFSLSRALWQSPSKYKVLISFFLFILSDFLTLL